MYTAEALKKYPYFARVLEDSSLEAMLDPLTRVLSRGAVTGFVRSLIEEGTPFTYAILDLDNFKYINDTYGHHIGDIVLQKVGESLESLVGDRGVAGRFGGDEMLIVNLRDLQYDEKKAFFVDLYDGRVMRRNYEAEEVHPFVTGTVGCATFPTDAADYDSLFALIDKTLYRGKTKGRNCYIIYVEEKHKNIEIRSLARKGLRGIFQSAVRQFEMVPGLMNKLKSVMPLLMEELQISDLYYVGKSGIMRSVRNESFAEPAPDIGELMRSDDLLFTNHTEELDQRSPAFAGTLKKMEAETLLIVTVGMDLETDGWLICAEAHNRRIWQDEDCAVLYFLAKMLAARIRIEGESFG